MGTTADKLARLNETKALLKTRLTEKGLDVASENNFYNLADKVGDIPTGVEIKSYTETFSGGDSFTIPEECENFVIFDTGFASGTLGGIYTKDGNNIFFGVRFRMPVHGIFQVELRDGITYVRGDVGMADEDIDLNGEYVIYYW